MSKYFVFKDGETCGPWSPAEIFGKLKVNKVSWTDYVFDVVKNDWEMLLNHPDFSGEFKKMNIPAPQHQPHQEKVWDKAEEAIWYILKKEVKYGPYSLLDLIRLLQEKSLLEYDYVYSQHLATWRKVSEVAEFRPENIKKIKALNHKKESEYFFRRKHARVSMSGSMWVHNQKRIWKASPIQLSAGGAGFELPERVLIMGDQVHIHFKPAEGVPPFNAICKVMSCRELEPGVFVYGVEFSSIAITVQRAIKDFSERAA
ncbi:MAG: GYF domain-containing protein [Proteobacteria bacterium]|jgi:hypothetical protein|nr:GYF domain-containing protein [Pseudomonadota bacterium]